MVFCQFMLPRFFDVQVPGSLLRDWFERLSSSDSSANQVREEIEVALRNWEAAKRWEPILDEKKRSLQAHASQASADGPTRTLAVITRLPGPLTTLLLGTEYYVAVPHTAST
jgi:hypothetical protein